jgi:phage gp29-like protein
MVTLYDHLGQPVRASELRGEVQTARVGYLAQEFAEHPSRGLTPSKLARILEDAERGDLTSQARLGEDMEEKDAHIYAELSKRRRCVLGVDWRLEPPREASAREKEETARVEDIVRGLDWETIVYDAAAAVLYGYSCQEIEWDRSGGEWRPKSVSYRPADWFMTPPELRDELRLRTLDVAGEPLRPFGWIVHRHKAKSGYLVRAALTRVLAWPFLFRNYSARDLAEFLEIYGLPLRLGKYPPGAGEPEKSTLMRAVVGIGHAAGGIIPEGMSIEFQEAAKGGSEPFMQMIDWAERSISKAILGGTLTSQTSSSGGGAYALGQVHNEVRRDILDSDLRQIAATMTHFLVEPLAQLNTSMAHIPRWVFDNREMADISAYAEALPKLVNIGFHIPLAWAHEQLGIPVASEDEPALEAASLPGFQGAQGDFAAAKSTASGGLVSARDVVEVQSERLEEESAAPFSGMIDAIKKIVDAAGSLEELRDGLLSAWPDMDAAAFAAVMGEALSAAQLAGRFDILEGI